MGSTVPVKTKRRPARSQAAAAEDTSAPTKTRGEATYDKIQRLYALNTQRKSLEKEEAALKDWFRCEAKGVDMTFDDGVGIQVVVTTSETRRIDAEAVRLELGADAARFEKTIRSVVVSVRSKAVA